MSKEGQKEITRILRIILDAKTLPKETWNNSVDEIGRLVKAAGDYPPVHMDAAFNNEKCTHFL